MEKQESFQKDMLELVQGQRVIAVVDGEQIRYLLPQYLDDFLKKNPGSRRATLEEVKADLART